MVINCLIGELEAQERLLQFTEFTSDTALKIGMMLVERARREKQAIAIDITRHGQCLFHFAFDGTTPDNEYWIAGKNRMVNRFGRSSYRLAQQLKQSGKTIEERFHVSGTDHFACGGAFPILIKNVGAVGTITVSGMPDEMDHAYLVDAIKQHLAI